MNHVEVLIVLLTKSLQTLRLIPLTLKPFLPRLPAVTNRQQHAARPAAQRKMRKKVMIVLGFRVHDSRV